MPLTGGSSVDPGAQWVSSFLETPVVALHQLLSGAFDFRRPVMDAADLLPAWFNEGRRFHGSLPALDAGIAEWLYQTPDRLSVAEESTQALEVDAVVAGLRAIDGLRRLPRTAKVLQHLVGRRREFSVFYAGPGRDPEGALLIAASRHQLDRSLLEEWWSIASMREREPLHFGQIGVSGVDLAPPEPGDEGVLRNELVLALARYGEGLYDLEKLGRIPTGVGRMQFVLLSRRLQRQYPFPEHWAVCVSSAGSALPGRWLDQAIPSLRLASDEGPEVEWPQGWSRSLEADSETQRVWSREASTARQRIVGRNPRAYGDADRLLREQREHANRTGEVKHLTRSLCSLATGAVRVNPRQAVAWASEARGWDSSDPYCWTVEVNARLQAEGPASAVGLAWEAVERFPYHSAAANLLAHVLTRGRRLDLAEAIYLWSRVRFPEDPHSLGGLAEVAKHKEDLPRAESIYRAGLDGDFSNNEALILGLAAVLRLDGPDRWDEAETLLERCQTIGGDLGRIGREADRLASARRGNREAQTDTSGVPDEVELDASTSLRAGRVLRSAYAMAAAPDGLPSAYEFVQAGQSDMPANRYLQARAEAETVLLSLTDGDVEGASRSAERSALRNPGSPAVAYAQARSRRTRAGLEQRAFSVAGVEELVAPWMRLQSMTPLSRGVILLAEVRASAAMYDGVAVDDAVDQGLVQLREWSQVAGEADGPLAERIARTPLLDPNLAGAEATRAALVDHGPILDDLEESEVLALS